MGGTIKVEITGKHQRSQELPWVLIFEHGKESRTEKLFVCETRRKKENKHRIRRQNFVLCINNTYIFVLSCKVHIITIRIQLAICIRNFTSRECFDDHCLEHTHSSFLFLWRSCVTLHLLLS